VSQPLSREELRAAIRRVSEYMDLRELADRESSASTNWQRPAQNERATQSPALHDEIAPIREIAARVDPSLVDRFGYGGDVASACRELLQTLERRQGETETETDTDTDTDTDTGGPH
jgi:hypothetical protein